MLWLVYSLIAAVFYGVKTAIHRHVMKTANPFSYALFENITGAIVFLPFFILFFEMPNGIFPWVIVLISSVIWALIMPLVHLSHKYTEASIRAPVIQTSVLFIFIFSMIFLGELFTFEKGIGTLLIFFGLVVLSYHKGKKFGKLSDKGIQLTLLSAFLASIAIVLDKYAMGFFPAEMYVFLIFFFPGLFLFLFYRKKLQGTVQLWKSKYPYIIVMGLLSINYFFMLKAYELVDMSLAYPIVRLGTLVTLGIGFTVYKERGEVLKRILGAVIMILGACFIAGVF